MALTDVIEKDLLRALDDGAADVEDALHRYSGSKGPLYAALTRATTKATARLGDLEGQLRKTRAEARTAEAKTADLERRATEGERRLKKTDQQLQRTTAALQANTALLDRVEALASHGLDAAALDRLGGVFDRAAGVDGASPSDAVGRLLDAVEAHVDLATALRAAQDQIQAATKAEADAREREARAKARDTAVDGAAWLVSQRVSGKTVLAWQSIAEALGMPPEELAQGVAAALRDAGSAEAARRKSERDLAALADEKARLTAENEALRAKQGAIRAALTAVAKDGSARLQSAEEQAAQAIATARQDAVRAIRAVQSDLTSALQTADGRVASVLERYTALTNEAARLEPQVAFARALTADHIEAWREVRPLEWAALLRHLGGWLAVSGSDPAAPRLDVLAQDIANRLRYPSLYGSPHLSDVAVWLTEGLLRWDSAATTARAP